MYAEPAGGLTRVDKNPAVQSGSSFSENPAHNGQVVSPVPGSTGRVEPVFKTLLLDIIVFFFCFFLSFWFWKYTINKDFT
jgi:hypothetical protein